MASGEPRPTDSQWKRSVLSAEYLKLGFCCGKRCSVVAGHLESFSKNKEVTLDAGVEFNNSS